MSWPKQSRTIGSGTEEKEKEEGGRRKRILIEVRRGTNERIYNDYRKEVCDKKGEVKGNLTEEGKDGLKSLQKRMREQKIIIMKTDKSGKMCVISREEY